MSILCILDFYDGCPQSRNNTCELILNVKAILKQQFMKLDIKYIMYIVPTYCKGVFGQIVSLSNSYNNVLRG